MSFDAERYWNDRHRASEGLDGVGFKGLGALNAWAYRVRLRAFNRMLRPHDVRGARVLDVGAGTGVYLEAWKALGAREVVGIDLSEVACEKLRARGFDARCVELGGGAEGTLGSFDFVSAMDVLYHIVDDAKYQKAFDAIARLLKPGGTFVFTENFLQHHARMSTAWQVSRTKSEIEHVLSSAGLTLERRAPCFVLMNNPLDTDSAALKKSWWALSKLSGRSALAGHALGAALFPVEVALTKILSETPSSEIALARRA